MMEANANMVALNGTNYHLWKGKMKDLLFVKKLHLLVITTQKPDSMSEEEWDFEHQQVCGFIRQYVEDNGFINIGVGDFACKPTWECSCCLKE